MAAQGTVLGILLGFCIALVYQKRAKKAELSKLHAELAKERLERQAERTGRIRAQKELKESRLAIAKSSGAFPLTPIGVLRSCFSTRNGTPRQPLLVPFARARLQLTPGNKGVPPAALEGLTQYSHCWLLYLFHDNTDLTRLWSAEGHAGFRAKVRVPRLDGGRLGVLATRSPHRPCPIGLSVAKVEGIEKGELLLSGADVVDGSPVLDVKPYLPFCDSVGGASAPPWVQAESEDDPLKLHAVSFSPTFAEQLDACWATMGKSSLYKEPVELQALVAQVLSRDIRSVYQRHKTHAHPEQHRSSSEGAVAPEKPKMGALRGKSSYLCREERTDIPSDEAAQHACPVLSDSMLTEETAEVASDGNRSTSIYHLLVEGIDVAYSVSSERLVEIKTATLAPERRRGLLDGNVDQ